MLILFIYLRIPLPLVRQSDCIRTTQQQIQQAMEVTIDKLVEKAEAEMGKSYAQTQKILAKFNVNRVHPDMVRGLLVDYYGSQSTLESLASIGRDPNSAVTLTIKPWEKSVIPMIESALTKSNQHGFSFRNNGQVIYASFPPLTEERRISIAKQVGIEAEQGKVAIRRVRRDIREEMKDIKEEDQVKRGDAALQKLTDSWVLKIKTLEDQRKKELMKV